MKILKQNEIGKLAESLCEYALTNKATVIISISQKYQSDIQIEIRDKDTYAMLSSDSYVLDNSIGAEDAISNLIKDIK